MSKQQLTPRINRLENNIIIDGGSEIWPEGTSRSVANNTAFYGSVLFKLENTTTGITLTNSQQASIPTSTDIPFSNQVSKTASGSVAAGTVSRLRYIIEGYDIQKLVNNDFSVIFWVKSSVASSRSIALGAAGYSNVQQYSITATNTWQLKVVKFSALNSHPAFGSLNRSNGSGLTINFNIVSGSTFQTSSLNSWISGSFLQGPSEDTTWLTGTTHDFSIAGVMVLPGDWTTLASNASIYRFVRAGKNFAEEYLKSQRYFEKSYDLAVNPGTFPNFRGSSNGNGVNIQVVYKASKLNNAPSIVIYNPNTGATGSIIDNVDRAAVVGTNGGNTSSGENGFTITFGGNNTFTAFGHWTSDARF